MGQFLISIAASYGGLYSALEVEATALKKVLSWLKTQEFTNVIIETDAQAIVQCLANMVKDITLVGLLILECHNILSQCPHFTLSFVRRQANVVSHALTKLSYMYATPCIWEEPPVTIVGALSHDISSMQ